MATVEDKDVEIRSSELEMDHSSNAKSIGKKVDTVVSNPLRLSPFMPSLNLAL